MSPIKCPAGIDSSLKADHMHELLMQLLVSGPEFVWQGILRTSVRNIVARHARNQLDLAIGDVRDGWRALDEPRSRRRLFGGRLFWDTLTESIVSRRGLRAAFNNLLRNNHLRQVNATQFRTAVNTVVPVLLQRPVSKPILNENPFPAVWALLANLLAADVHGRTHPAFPEPEWSLLQVLLFAGFFSTCRLPRASQVADLFREHREVLLSVRGEFLRIPECIGPDGVLDRPVPISTRPRGPVNLATAGFSPIVAATAFEANQTLNGQGLLHRMIPVNDPRYAPPSFLPARAARHLLSGRDTSYRLYEHTIVTFLALSAIEFLLRTWAQHRNTNEAAQIPIFKANNQPNGVLDWINELGCSVGVLDSVRELYDPNHTNIRNRVLHGNLLEIHAKRLEVHLPVIQPATFGWLASNPDPYHPENIASHCLECLERIDAAMAGLGIVAGDATWTQSVMLTTAEIDFGHNEVPCDFFGPDGESWARAVSDYLNAVMPSLKQLFTIGFIEWMRGQYQLNPVTGMVMGFVYEAMHRLTVHLMGANITGLRGGTVQKSHQAAGNISRFQYRMLDTRQDGLFSVGIRDRILDHLPVTDRPKARHVFELAMKARNALAHGALIQTDQHTLDSLGHIFAKATQTLITAGLHHLTREGAYYTYRNEHPDVHGRDAEDWERARHEIFARIARVAQEVPWEN